MGNVDEFTAIAPGIWNVLQAVEGFGGIPITDVEFKARYTDSGRPEAKAMLDTGDFSVATVVAALRKINDYLMGEIKTAGAYPCSAQPSGRQQGVRVHGNVNGTSIIVSALLDADEYEAATAQESALPVVAA